MTRDEFDGFTLSETRGEIARRIASAERSNGHYSPTDIKPDGAFVSELLPSSEWSPTIGQPVDANSVSRTNVRDGVSGTNLGDIVSDPSTCLAHAISIPQFANDKYTTLRAILDAAFNHAATGKGKERHARSSVPFDKQPMLETTRLVGPGFPLGQAIKKAGEAAGMIERGQMDMAEAECLGAINYLAGCVAWMREQATMRGKEAS